MQTYNPVAPVYRYFTTNLLTNTILAEIPFQGVSYERALSAAGSFSGSIPMLEETDHLDLYESTMPGKTALYVVRNDVCVWGGIIWSRSYDIIGKTISVSASEFPSYLQHRLIWGNFIYDKQVETITPSGANVAITISDSDQFVAPSGSSVYLDFKPAFFWDLNGFYTVLASPAPTANTFYVSMSGFPNNRSVSSRSLTNGVVSITTSANHEFEEGMTVVVSGVGAPFNGTFVIADVPATDRFTYSLEKTVIKRSASANVATITTAENHEFSAGQSIRIEDVGTGYDGTRTIANVPSNTTLTFTTTIGSENEVTSIAGSVYRANIANASSSGTAKIYLSNTDVTVTFRTDTYDYTRSLLKEVFTDFVAPAGENAELGVIPENLAGKIQHSAAVTTKQISNNVATLTTSGRTNIFTGQRIEVFNVDSTFDGEYTVSSVDRANNKISYAKTAANTGPTSVSSSPLTVTYRELSNGIVTLTTSTAHGLTAGKKIRVSGVDPKYFNVSVYNSPKNVDGDTGETIIKYFKIIDVPSSTTLTYKAATRVVTDTNGDKTWFLSEPNSKYSVAYRKLRSNVATIWTTENHSLKIGDVVDITNMVRPFNQSNVTVTAVPSNKSFRFAVTGKDSVKQPSPGVVTAVKRKVQNGTIDGSGRIISQTYGPFPGQANAAITVDSGFSNVNYKPTNLYGSNMQFAKEHLDNYITQTQGFDYRIDCTYHAPSSSFRRNFTFVPVNLPSPPAFGDVSPISRFGADNLVFEYPGNVMNLSFDESAEDVATRFFVQYSKTDANGFAPFVGAANGQLLRDGWPLLDMAEKQDWPVLDVNNYRDKFPNMDLQDAFFRIGKRYLNESRPPIAAIQVTVNGSIVPEIGTYNPGDWCSLVIDDRFVLERLRSDLEPRNTALVRKIVAFSVSVPDGPASPESVTLSLLPEWEVDVYGE